MRLNSKNVGDISEIAVMQKFIEMGFEVSKPFGDNARYDLIVDIRNKLYRVQVKTCGQNKDGNTIDIRSYSSYAHRGGAKKYYTTDEIDLLIGYYQKTKEFYIFPKFSEKSAIKLRLKPSSNSQYKSINLASDFLLIDYIKSIFDCNINYTIKEVLEYADWVQYNNKTKVELKLDILYKQNPNINKNNSQYGTCWIYNKILKENKKIPKSDYQQWKQKGWINGRKMEYYNYTSR